MYSLNKHENAVENFKVKATKIHNGKYDYSKVVHCDQKTKIEIICPVHGSFFQRKDSHVKGAGCKKCLYENMPLKRTIEEFIVEANEVHSNRYDYSLVHTTKTTEKVKILCNQHGIFEQTVAHHLVSRGCPECSFDSGRLSLEEFIKRSNEIHSFKYDYSLVELTKGSTQKVRIICPTHGEFLQTSGPHSLGSGCAKCGLEKSLTARYSAYTTDAFIDKSKQVHGDKYNYSLSEYVNTETKIKIICSEHGVFAQRPLCHVRGKGCIKCRNENTTYNFIQKYRDNPELGSKIGMVYILRVFNDSEEFIKLGITSNKSGRFKRYRKQFKAVGYSFEILLEKEMPNYQTAMLENDILKKFRKCEALYKPSFDFSGKSECILVEFLEELKEIVVSHTEEKYFE